jgi:hypothetical protein
MKYTNPSVTCITFKHGQPRKTMPFLAGSWTHHSTIRKDEIAALTRPQTQVENAFAARLAQPGGKPLLCERRTEAASGTVQRGS